MKTFSFPKNGIFSENAFTRTKHSLSPYLFALVMVELTKSMSDSRVSLLVYAFCKWYSFTDETSRQVRNLARCFRINRLSVK